MVFSGSGSSNAAAMILDVSSNSEQPGVLFSELELFLEYHSQNNDDGFEAEVSIQANSKFPVLCAPRTQRKDVDKSGKQNPHF